MADWIDSKGRRLSTGGAWSRGARVEFAPQRPQGMDPQIVVISSNPRLAVPNFDRCRRDGFCRCRRCKPSLAAANG